MCVTDRHDMTSAVKVASNLNTTNQPTNHYTKAGLGCKSTEKQIKYRTQSP